MYDKITPEQWIYGAAIGLIVVGALLVILFRMTLPQKEHTPTMSSGAWAILGELVRGLVHVPVAPTDTKADVSTNAASGTALALPDTNAADAGFEMPRLSRHNTDRERIVYLAAQLKPDGKYRFSANEICTLMKGPRADVLAIVRQVRDGTPQYPPATPEQTMTRVELGLEN